MYEKSSRKSKFMSKTIDINFKVTPFQKETIDSRVLENGLDDLSTYLKIVALKMQKFNLTTAGSDEDEATVEIGFKVTESQKSTIEANMKESSCEDLTRYLEYVALHGVITAVVEVRSTGNLDAMLARIAKSRNLKI